MNLVLDDVKEITRGMRQPTHYYPYKILPSLTSYLSLFLADSLLEKTIIDKQPTDDEGNTSSRPLGLLVARGTLLVLISPLDGSEEIANPFVQAEEEGAAAI